MAGYKTLTGKTLKKSLRMLHEITTIFEKENIRYSLDGGTALGIIREGRLLPWDTDMDIAIDSYAVDNVMLILKKLPFWKYRIRIRLMPHDALPIRKNSTRLIKVWTRKYFFLKGDELLDIFIRYMDGEKVFWALGNDSVVLNSMLSKFHTQLKTIDFDKKKYWIPENEDEFLTFRYGNWRAPIKEWNAFENDGAIVKD